jgi:hypothetical protein
MEDTDVATEPSIETPLRMYSSPNPILSVKIIMRWDKSSGRRASSLEATMVLLYSCSWMVLLIQLLLDLGCCVMHFDVEFDNFFKMRVYPTGID